MIRARFYIKKSDCDNDYRPVKWPIKYPYWCSAESSNSFVLVAYAEDEDSIKELWPEAYDINVLEKDTEIRFTLRFPKPEWYDIKRLLNDMDKEIKKYNASIYYINKERSEVIADITQAMEDYLMPYIDDLAGAIRAAVWSRGVSEERTEAAVLSLIVSSLATTSGRLISGGYQIMKEMGGGWGGNPFTFMSIDKIRHLSTSLSDAITGGGNSS